MSDYSSAELECGNCGGLEYVSLFIYGIVFFPALIGLYLFTVEQWRINRQRLISGVVVGGSAMLICLSGFWLLLASIGVLFGG